MSVQTKPSPTTGKLYVSGGSGFARPFNGKKELSKHVITCSESLAYRIVLHKKNDKSIQKRNPFDIQSLFHHRNIFLAFIA